jgi:AcrR family transcriptional regulator
MNPATAETTAPARRQRADAQRNRAKVLDAAREAFARDGLDAQIDEIARGAGVGVGTVYRHFPTKEDLLQALADARFEGLAQAAREALEVEDPWEGFERFMTYSAEVMAVDRSLSEAMGSRPEMCASAAEHAGLQELTAQVVARAQASGQLRADAVPSDVPALVCGIGRAVNATDGKPTMSWERYLEIILAGLRA